jgi:REP element-mobilizing transposase RayT
MARLPRLVIPGHPHHVTQRGNRRTQTFFEEGDYALYKYLLSEAAQKIKRARLELSTGRIIDCLPCHMFYILNPTLAPLAPLVMCFHHRINFPTNIQVC